MLEKAAYSVTSPENAAALLYRESPDAGQVTNPLMLTAQDCLELGIIDAIVAEPPEGAHVNPDETAQRLKAALEAEMAALTARSTKRLLRDRYRKFRKMGEYSSHFRVALAQEVSHLQRSVAHGVRRIRRSRRRRSSPGPEQGQEQKTD